MHVNDIMVDMSNNTACMIWVAFFWPPPILEAKCLLHTPGDLRNLKKRQIQPLPGEQSNVRLTLLIIEDLNFNRPQIAFYFV